MSQSVRLGMATGEGDDVAGGWGPGRSPYGGPGVSQDPPRAPFPPGPPPTYGAPPPYHNGPYGPRPGVPHGGQYQYTYRPAAAPRRGGGVVWLVGLLGVMAVIGVGYFVVKEAMTSSGNGQIAQPTQAPNSSDKGRMPQGRAAAYTNPLYRAPKRPGIPCRAPKLNTHSTASMNRFLTRVSDCLDQSWARDFRSANIPFKPPTRVYWTQPGTSPCGNYPASGAAAFYCSTNHAMYIGLKDVVQNSANAPGKYYSIYVSVLAHEYGHHVQSAAGILDYGHTAESESTSTDERNQVSRRIELQANCFDGVYLHSIGRTLPLTRIQRRIVKFDAYYRGDRAGFPPDHGSRKHFRGWLVRGLAGGRPGLCNTWATADAHVD